LRKIWEIWQTAGKHYSVGICSTIIIKQIIQIKQRIPPLT
jgi:hypothetical protein